MKGSPTTTQPHIANARSSQNPLKLPHQLPTYPTKANPKNQMNSTDKQQNQTSSGSQLMPRQENNTLYLNVSPKKSIKNYQINADQQILKRQIEEQAFTKKFNNKQCIFQCQLCHNTFKETQLKRHSNNCSHKFCQKCLKQSKQQNNKNIQIGCPLNSCQSKMFMQINNNIHNQSNAYKLQQFSSQQNSIENQFENDNDKDNQIQEFSSDDNQVQQKNQNYTNQNVITNPIKQQPNFAYSSSKAINSPNSEFPQSTKPTLFHSLQTQMVPIPQKSDHNFKINQSNLKQIPKSVDVKNPLGISLSTQKYTHSNHGSETQLNGCQNKNFTVSQHLQSQSISLTKQLPHQPTLPQKLFSQLCTNIWSNQWSTFFKLLPLSLIILSLFSLFIFLWFLFIFLYFLIIWCISIPSLWSIHQIWGCFFRSIKNQYLRNFTFIISLIGFPLIFFFFYLLSFLIILYYSFYILDMKQLINGHKSLVLSCKKIYLHQIYMYNNQCKCYIYQKCFYCQNKNSILCLVI